MITSNASSKTKGSLSMVVVTADGRRYNLGRMTQGNPVSRWIQTLRIAYYRWHRARHIADPEQRREFIAQCDAWKQSRKAK